MLPKAHFATVYAKPAGRPLVDTFVTEVSQDTWILFPWDIEPQFAPPLAAVERRADPTGVSRCRSGPDSSRGPRGFALHRRRA